MNLNEFFFFKAIICSKKEKHDLDLCYFCHQENRDVRRLLIDFHEFFKNPQNYIDKNNDVINKNLLNYYSNEIGFENDIINSLLFNLSPCKNVYEYKYHILNYKQDKCYFENNNFTCMYGNLCSYVHEQIADYTNYENIQKVKILFENIVNPAKTITKKDVIEFYIQLYNSENKYSHTKQFLVDIESKYKFNQKNSENLHSNILNNLENSVILNSNIHDDFIKLNKKICNQNVLKSNIYNELKNIPVLSRGEDFNNIINTDNHIVFVSNTMLKKEELNKLLIAFLNSYNGFIIYGVDVNTNKITGVKMDRKARDFFRQTFNSEYKDYLIEYEGCIKYKFYDLESNVGKLSIDNLCIIVIKIKKIKDNKLVFDPYNKPYVIKEKFIKKYQSNNSEKIKTNDVKSLNMKEYIEISRDKLITHYRGKFL